MKLMYQLGYDTATIGNHGFDKDCVWVEKPMLLLIRYFSAL